MKKFLFLLLVFTITHSAISQTEDKVRKIQETARGFVRDGDYNNAVLVLNRGLENDKTNLELLKELAFTLFLKKDYVGSLEIAKPFAIREDVDVQAYQILAMVYKALEERKESEKLYKAALKKFPNSGLLHNEYGEMLWAKKDFSDAVKIWENGISVDPNTASNYYNAAKYYYFSSEKVWGLIYGEIFINIESYSARTTEIKKLLVDGYKKLFIDADISKNQSNKNEFANAVLDLMKKNSITVADGITVENLTTLRARFINDWYTKYATRFPFRLFEHHQQLVRLNMFDAYNQWIFADTFKAGSYQLWSTAHDSTNKEFIRLQQNRIFKIPPGQYYNTVQK